MAKAAELFPPGTVVLVQGNRKETVVKAGKPPDRDKPIAVTYKKSYEWVARDDLQLYVRTLPDTPPPRKFFETGDRVKTPEGEGVVISHDGLFEDKYITYDVKIINLMTGKPEVHFFVGSQMDAITEENRSNNNV